MLDRMGWGAGAIALAALAFQLGGAAEAQIAILTGTVDAPTCMARTVPCSDAGDACAEGEVCQSFGLDRKVCAPPGAIFCCSTDEDCPTDSTGTGGPLTCADVDGESRGICLPDNDYCASADGVLSARTIVACHTAAGSTVRQSYANGDCDRDGIRNGEDPLPCLPERIGVWVPGASGPFCASSDAAALVCNEVGDPCVLADERTAVCTANERTGGQLVCSTLPDLFCCGGFVHIACPAGECVLPSDIGDGQGMCTNPALLCSERPTMDELLRCHTFGGALTTIEDGDCDGDTIRNVDETEETRCVPNAPTADGGVVTSDGGNNQVPDAGSPGPDSGAPSQDDGGAVTPFDAGGTPIDPRFNGGGGCACRSTPDRSSGGWWLVLVAAGVTIVRRRR